MRDEQQITKCSPEINWWSTIMVWVFVVHLFIFSVYTDMLLPHHFCVFVGSSATQITVNLAKTIDEFGWISTALGCHIKLPKIATLKAIILVHSPWTWFQVIPLHVGPLKRQSLLGGEIWKIGYLYMSCELCSSRPILLLSPPPHPCWGWEAWHLSALG